MVAINKYSNVPLYCQLKNLILKKIETGEFLADQKIPSELDLCEKYNISRPTVRQAINELTTTGQLYKLKGKGTFVSAQKTQISIKDYTGFTDSILDSHNLSEKDLLSVEVVSGKNHSDVLDAFGLKADDNYDFACISFTNVLNNEAMSLNTSYIPLHLFPEIIEDIHSNKDVLRGKYPLIPSVSKSILEIISTDQREAVYLKLQPGQPLIKIKNLLYSKSGQPVEYIVAKYRADKTRLQFENHK